MGAGLRFSPWWSLFFLTVCLLHYELLGQKKKIGSFALWRDKLCEGPFFITEYYKVRSEVWVKWGKFSLMWRQTHRHSCRARGRCSGLSEEGFILILCWMITTAVTWLWLPWCVELGHFHSSSRHPESQLHQIPLGSINPSLSFPQKTRCLPHLFASLGLFQLISFLDITKRYWG